MFSQLQEETEKDETKHGWRKNYKTKRRTFTDLHALGGASTPGSHFKAHSHSPWVQRGKRSRVARLLLLLLMQYLSMQIRHFILKGPTCL